MIGSLFASKNQKLVKSWLKEHKKIVELAHKVINTYTEGKLKATKKALLALNNATTMHLMTEDIEFYRLLKDKKRATAKTVKLINEFRTSFEDTKSVLRDFLLTYTKDDAILDDKFFQTFKTIVNVLGKRIIFEENNLYEELASK